MKVVIVKEIEEMPIDCDSCPFQGYNRYCQILGEYTSLNEWLEDAPYYDLKGKGDCPLKPLPRKLNETEIVNGEIHGYRGGWNDCLDEITGETE